MTKVDGQSGEINSSGFGDLVPPPSYSFKIELDAIDTYYYATSHRPVVRSLTLTNTSNEPYEGELVVRVRVESPTDKPLVHNWDRALPTILPKDSENFHAVKMLPNHVELARLEEQVPANLVAEALIDDVVVGETRQGITFFAYRQWMHQPDYWDSLSAFVLPNHPDIAGIITRARELLEVRTGDPSTAAYQMDSAHDLRIAEALYDAVAELGIAYSNPPASFEGFGQKIRTPEVVLAERAMTCLDSTVFMASVLSATGLDPVLFLVKGHAFVGYLTKEVNRPLDGDERVRLRELLRRPVLQNSNEIAWLISIGMIVPIETTTLNRGSGKTNFEKAVDCHAQMFVSGLQQIEGLVNVAECRRVGVPILVTRRLTDGLLREVVVAGDIPQVPQAPNVEATTKEGVEHERLSAFEAPSRVRSWMNSLLDLTYSNPLLNMKGRNAVELKLVEGQLARLEDRIASGNIVTLLSGARAPRRLIDEGWKTEKVLESFTEDHSLYFPDPLGIESLRNQIRTHFIDEGLPPADASHNADLGAELQSVKDLNRSVGSIRRRAREIETQTGSNQLYLGIGTITWDDPGARSARQKSSGAGRAPLFLLPVRISGSADTAFEIRADESGELVPNYCLHEKLRAVFGFSVPELETPVLDDAGIDVDRLISQVRLSLGAANLTGVRVEATTHLAVLNFSTFRLWKDMREHWKEFMANRVVRHLVESPGQNLNEAEVAGLGELEILCPHPSDEFQNEAVRWAVEGRSFVLEGPPGTGKSQTIANLLAASLAAGKKVLFVAEKQAALSVVKARVKEVGLGPLCLDLHDKGSTPDQIRTQLKDALDFGGVDASAAWGRNSDRYASVAEQLTNYRNVIHETNAAGVSVWSARQSLADLPDGESFTIPRDFIEQPRDDEEIRRALLNARTIADTDRYKPTDPWLFADRIDFESVDREKLETALLAIRALLEMYQEFAEPFRKVLMGLRSPNDFGRSRDLLDGLLDGDVLSAEFLNSIESGSWSSESLSFVDDLSSFQQKAAPVMATYLPTVLTIDVAPYIAAGIEATNAGLFSKRAKQRGFLDLLRPYLVGGTELTIGEMLSLLQMCPLLANDAKEIRDRAAKIEGFTFGSEWNPVTADDEMIRGEREAVLSRAEFLSSEELEPFLAAIAMGWKPSQSDRGFMADFESAWSVLWDEFGVSDRSFARWVLDRNIFDALRESLDTWIADSPRFLALQRRIEFSASMQPLRDAGLTDVAESLIEGRATLHDAYDQYLRGIFRGSLVERLESGRIDQFDGRAHSIRIDDFADLDRTRRSLMQEVIPRRLVDGRPFRPGVRMGEYGELERELSKTTRRISIRKLFERYGKIIPDLTPCFLMSPDSVARFLPAQSVKFDIVVFDEASQIPVATAIGAMGRANSVVVVGDSQQMPPSTFGVAAVVPDEEIEDDEPVFEDLESILSECVESNLPRLYLQCHYRSRHEELIAFSNNAFYEGRLTTFPAPTVAGSKSIFWHRVEGQFLRSGTVEERRTNPIEAEAIVEEIRRRVNHPETAWQSICVVTLNVQQQALITSLLEGSGDSRIKALLDLETNDSLIVRNLESVQGDERDVVMLSAAFSNQTKVASGGAEVRSLPLNFGPLNRRGGERRLNVAITRAKHEVHVFCSFDPEDMKLAEDPAKGLVLLKEYFEIARAAGGGSADLAARAPSAPDHHRRAIAKTLRDNGLVVEENIGLSNFRVDLAVASADGLAPKLAILLDGPSWASRATPFDREILPVAVLQDMGWCRVIRIWTPEWILDPGSVVARVREQVVKAESAPLESRQPIVADAPKEPTTTDGSHEPSLNSPNAESANSDIATSTEFSTPTRAEAGGENFDPFEGIERFVPASTEVIGSKNVIESLPNTDSVEVVRSQIESVVAVEAPIEIGRLVKIICDRFGAGKATANRVNAISQLIPQDAVRTSDFGSFVWSESRNSTWDGFRVTPSGVRDRDIEKIAPEEILNVTLFVVRQGRTMNQDEIVRLVRNCFGFERAGEKIKTRIENVLKSAVNAGSLAFDGDRYSVALP